MKKILALILILVSLFSVVSCGEEDDGFEYYELGLHFNLAEGFENKKVSFAEVCYSDGDAYFFFHVYNSNGIEETLGYDGDISVYDYTKQFMIINGLDFVKGFEYDEERKMSTIIRENEETYVGSGEYDYLMHVIFRGTAHLYIVTMTCPQTKTDKYLPLFETWKLEMVAD